MTAPRAEMSSSSSSNFANVDWMYAANEQSPPAQAKDIGIMQGANLQAEIACPRIKGKNGMIQTRLNIVLSNKEKDVK